MAAYLALVVVFTVALAAISFRANRRLPASDRLPMQWGFDGRPTWNAPRRIALAFTPALYVLTSLGIAFLMPVHWEPATLAMLGVFTFVAAGFIAGHLLHIRLIRRGGWSKRTD
ncbi:MAG: hypothetical protein IT549_02705 [Novosphingobium sp.]|nr:hypothetical protein [Novosphingobium sp.]